MTAGGAGGGACCGAGAYELLERAGALGGGLLLPRRGMLVYIN